MVTKDAIQTRLGTIVADEFIPFQPVSGTFA